MKLYSGQALTRLSIALSFSLGMASATVDAVAQSTFQPEATGKIDALPQKYPDHWLMVIDYSFLHMRDGKVVIVDTQATTAAEQYKGKLPASLLAAYTFSGRRAEHYVAETFYSRGGRGGIRTDVVTIWDTAKLSVLDEVEIPAKRLSGMPKRLSIQLIDDDRLLLIYNFTPAQSVSVVNLETRTFAGEVNTPGCGFMIPTGKRGFSSICANGALLSTTLNADGSVSATHRTKPLIDVDDDPVFEAMARIGDIGYLPTFMGRVVTLNLARNKPRQLKTWSLLSAADQAEGWRPGGILPIIEDPAGHIYVLMHPEGYDGSHKDGGSEVWVFDAARHQLLRRIPLKNWGISLGMTGSQEQPLLIVTNADMGIDVYDATQGAHLKTLGISLDTPFSVEAPR